MPNVASHQTVNHSLNFVDPSTRVHTQNTKSYWARTKRKFKRMKEVAEDQFPFYLDEFMWKERYRRTAREAYVTIHTKMYICVPHANYSGSAKKCKYVGVPVKHCNQLGLSCSKHMVSTCSLWARSCSFTSCLVRTTFGDQVTVQNVSFIFHGNVTVVGIGVQRS